MRIRSFSLLHAFILAPVLGEGDTITERDSYLSPPDQFGP